MVIDVYCGNIGVPGKCGSRYFTNTIPFWGEPEYRKSFKDFYNGMYNLDYIIIRNPFEHLKSGLKTEVMECFDDELKIKKILNQFINTDIGGTHFHPHFCKRIYSICYKSKWKLKIVDLSNLSKFIEEKLHRIEFNENDYDFHKDPTFKTKEQVWGRCMDLYPDLMNKLVEFTNFDIKYYHALLNDNRDLIKLI
jgi:hypothetical protein